MSILCTYFVFMLLKLNWEWRSTVLGIVWVRRTVSPEVITVKTDKTDKKMKKVIKIHTSKHYGTRGFTGGRDRSMISESRRQRKGRRERRTGRTDSGIIRACPR